MSIILEGLRPARGKLLGEIIGGDYVSAGGILVVNSVKKKKPRKCRIVAIGGPFVDNKGRAQVYRAAVGQIAHFKLSEGMETEIERKKYIFLENEDIVAVEE